MDTLHLEVEKPSEERFRGQIREVRIRVNGRDIIDIVRDYELRFMARDESRLLAGGYAGLPPEEVFLPSMHFLGDPQWEVYRDGEKVSVLECPCGFPGCWPLLVRVTVEGDRVIWSDFEQPHRRRGSPAGEWRYDNLGPFVFDRKQYLEALRDTSTGKHKQDSHDK